MIILHDKAGSSGPPLTFKPIEHFYVHIKMLFLHGNKSEFGAKTVNIKMSWAVITLFVAESEGVSEVWDLVLLELLF